MTEEFTTLTKIAGEFEGLAKAHAEQARMADDAAHRPGMSPAQTRVQLDTAAKFRQAAAHFETRGKACRAGAEALERAASAVGVAA